MKRSWQIACRDDLTRFVMSAWNWKLEKPVEITVNHLDQRTAEQNSLLHAALTDIAKQMEWAGAKRSVVTWKRLMTAAWLRAIGREVEILPSVDGSGFDMVLEPTSGMTVAQLSSLVEYVLAWGANNGVDWSEK